MGKIIAIEGNIGAGKTTLGNRLSSQFGYKFIEEPVESWRNQYDDNVLDLFYQDPKRWGFTFQVMALTTRAKTMIDMGGIGPVILERTIETDYHVFAKACYRRGLMTNTEYAIYRSMYESLSESLYVKPDLVIYIRTPYDECARRIDIRSRGEETGISVDYLRELEQLHDDWLLDNPRVVTINGLKPHDLGDFPWERTISNSDSNLSCQIIGLQGS